MKSTVSTIAKNTAAMMGSQMITWVLALALTIVMPRYLGPGDFGRLQIANSFWVVAGTLAAWGMDTFLTKEIARRPERTAQLLKTSLGLRTLLFFGVTILSVLYAVGQGYGTDVLLLGAIIGLGQLVVAYAMGLGAALQGLELMDRASVANIITKVFYVAAGIGVLVLGFDLYVFAWIIVASNIVMLLSYYYFLRPHLHNYDQSLAVSNLNMLRFSSPYLVSGLILTAYGAIDTLIIGMLINSTVVGWYSVAIQLYGTLLFIPVLFSSAIFPAVARSFAEGSAALQPLVRKSFDLTLLLTMPIGLGMVIVGNSVVKLLFGVEFVQSGPILQLMGIVLIFTSLNTLLGRYLIAIDRQNIWNLIILVAAVLTIGLDLLLVPWSQHYFGNGAIGAAISYIVTEMGMLFVGIGYLPSGLLGWKNLFSALRILGAGLLMLLATWWSRDMFIALPVLVGALSYGAAILAVRAVPPEDLQFARIYLGRLRKHLRQKLANSAESAL